MNKTTIRIFALIMSVILALGLVLGLIPAVSAAEVTQSEETSLEQILTTNQSGVSGAAVAKTLPTQWNEKLGVKPTNEQKVLNASGENSVKNAVTFYSDELDELVQYIRDSLEARTASFAVTLRTSSYYDIDAFCEGAIDAAFDHTGVSTEGDYLRWHWKSWGCNMNGYEGSYITYTYSFTYLTTASQETATTTAVNNLLKKLNLSGKSDYQKVCAIYDWMCDNITYDYTGLDKGIDASPTTWTAYKGIVKGTCVCQGYASLFYRLALESGLSARVITGDGGGPHAWNIVKLGSKYYNLDATWDAGYSTYDWFLLGSANFADHYRDFEYSIKTYHTLHPTSTTDYNPSAPTPNPTPSGLSGDVDGDGALTTDDAIYLLLHIMFGEEDYPLAV